MMRTLNIFLAGGILLAALMTSCTNELESPEVDITTVRCSIPQIDVEEDFATGILDTLSATKATFSGSNFLWSAGDKIGIVPTSGAQIYFSVDSGAGTSTASFDGGDWAMKSTGTFYAYYPLYPDIFLSKDHVSVSYVGQTQSGNNNNLHTGYYWTLYTEGTSAVGNTLNFTFNHLTSFFKTYVTVPAGTYTKIVFSAPSEVFIKEGYFDLGAQTPTIVGTTYTNELSLNLQNVTFTDETELTGYLVVAPVNIAGIPITVSVYKDGVATYEYTLTKTSAMASAKTYAFRATTLTQIASSVAEANALYAAGATSVVITAPLTDDATVVLPDTAEAVSLTLPTTASTSKLTVSYSQAASSYPATLAITAAEGSDLDIQTPNSTVTVNGVSYNHITSRTAANTCIIPAGVTVSVLKVIQGGVQVYGTVSQIDLSEQEDDAIINVSGTVTSLLGEDDEEYLPATGVTLNQSSISLTVGATKTLTATVAPVGAYPEIIWTSSDETVATVSSTGVVTAVAAGTATITAKTISGGFSVSCDVTVGQIIDLSANGNANCYIVPEAGTYKFDAVKGNSYTSVGDVKGVKVLWESFGTTISPAVGDLIKPNVTYSDGYISFETNDPFTEGNALIAAYSDALCSEGNVLWSWHIWLTDQPEEQVYANNAGTMMDRNLGATSAIPGEVGTYGLMYEWGRKDPFLGSATHPVSGTLVSSTLDWPDYITTDATRGTMEFATKHPTTYIYYHGPNSYDWVYSGDGTARWSCTDKAIYDPCPPGWHVPSLGVWTGAGFVDHENIPYDTEKLGILFDATLCGSESWYPITGAYFDSPVLSSLNSCFLWSSSMSNGWGLGYYFTAQANSSNAFACWGSFEAYCMMPVRCCKDNAVEIGVSLLSVDKKVMGLTVGSEKTIVATIKPNSQSFRTVTWTSSNNTIATVSSDGVVTGVSEGEATITATVDGISANCSVLVGDYADGTIAFADNQCKRICVRNWDKDGDGELSYVEAGFVKKISREFSGSTITSFDEFQYFVNCTKIESYKHKSNGDWYADGAFEDVSSLVSITLPPSITSLGENCFNGCSLLSAIVIPESVTSIGYACFAYCSQLNRVSVRATTPPSLSFYDTYYETIQSDPKTFYRVPGNIYVPTAAISTYKACTEWSLYASKILGE